jgi:hypothetical protein
VRRVASTKGAEGPTIFANLEEARVTARQLARCWAALPRYPRCPATPNHVVIRSAATRNLAESRSRHSAVIAQPGPAVDSVDRRSCKLHPPCKRHREGEGSRPTWTWGQKWAGFPNGVARLVPKEFGLAPSLAISAVMRRTAPTAAPSTVAGFSGSGSRVGIVDIGENPCGAGFRVDRPRTAAS